MRSTLVLLATLLAVMERHTAAATAERFGKGDSADRAELKILLLFVYIGVAIALFSFSNKGDMSQAKEINTLNHRVLRAVYSQPKLKEQIERDFLFGEKIGFVPPIGDITSFGAHRKEMRAQIGKRFAAKLFPYLIGLAFGMFLTSMENVSIGSTAVLLGLALLGQFSIYALCDVRKPMKRKCICCACGRSTTAAAEQEEEKAAVRCDNCNNTGVCIPGCPHCDESQSMVRAFANRPACMLCSLYGFMCCSIGMYLRGRFLGVRSTKKSDDDRPHEYVKLKGGPCEEEDV